MAYLLAALVCAAMTATPLPLPPSWLLLAYLAIELDAHPAGMVVAGAAGAACGRVALASAARVLGPRLLSPASRDNLGVLETALQGRRPTLAAAGLLALSPPPAGALYTAAGLLRVHLGLVWGACFAGRLVTYGIGVALVGSAAEEVADRLRDAVGPLSLGVGLALVAGALWLLTLIDWRATLAVRRPRLRSRLAWRR